MTRKEWRDILLVISSMTERLQETPEENMVLEGCRSELSITPIANNVVQQFRYTPLTLEDYLPEVTMTGEGPASPQVDKPIIINSLQPQEAA